MASRIIDRDAAAEVTSMPWARLAYSAQTVAVAGMMPAGTAEGNSGREQTAIEALEKRIVECQAEMETRVKQAREHGLREGEAAGVRKAAAEVDAAVGRLGRTIEELSGTRRRLRAEAEHDIVKLALAIARRVLHREITMDPDALLGLVRVALQKIDARELYQVRVHPADAPAVEKHLQAIGAPARVQITGDAALERGAAIFETSRGNLDASISTQLEEVERGFGDLLRSNQ